MNYAIHTLLARTGHAQQNYLRPYLSQLGLSPGQPKVLRCLYAKGSCSQKELADYCEVDPAAICRMLDILERGPEKFPLRKKAVLPLKPGKNNAAR